VLSRWERFGFAARSVVFMMIELFLLYTARDSNSRDAKGLQRPVRLPTAAAGNLTRAGSLSLREETQGAVMNPNEHKPGQQHQRGQHGGKGGSRAPVALNL
jgi:hypothetical protein